MLADPELDAVVIATPVPTHYELAKLALEAGKHVFVEKPPAMTGAEIDELVALAEERDLVLMPGHLLLYHPGVRKLRELVDDGALGDVLCVYGNRQNLGRIRPLRERALVARRPRPLGDPLPPRRGPGRGRRARPRLPPARRRGRRLLLPPVPVGEDRAHAPLLARPAQDAEDDRRRDGEDGRVRRHGARSQGHGLREVALAAGRTLRRVADADRRHPHPEDRHRRAAEARVPRVPADSSRETAIGGRSPRTELASCARSTC